MKNKIFKLSIFVCAIFLLFSSCKVKKYAGFNVENNIIEIVVKENKIEMPLSFYKILEESFLDFSDDYNDFDSIDSKIFEKYKILTKDIYSVDCSDFVKNADNPKVALSKFSDNQKYIKSAISTFNKMDKKSFENIENFTKELSDQFDILIYIMGEVADFNNNNAPWYNNVQEIFDDAMEDDETKASLRFIEKTFPKVKFNWVFKETVELEK